MFTEERLAKILELLKINGKVNVNELSETFNVTKDCIRKDLKQLELAGNLQRTYGGALPIEKKISIYDISEREKADIETKQIIAAKALNLIEECDTIFLDMSTINILIARLLLKTRKKITVVTNMLEIMTILAHSNTNITLVATSGVYNKNLHGFIGSPTIDLIKKYIFDKSFIGNCGVNLETNDLTTFELEDGITKKVILESSKKAFLVMEQKKFYTQGNYKFATFKGVFGVITNTEPSEDICRKLSEQQVNLF
ncbi:MAG: DeoR family transcriptional regulator [Candidatus Epulonipiscium fishelsonii]|nr:MAG: DeoR family transcriptional regulator [Epulopiscium sp. AS2M-Bin002]